MTQSKPHKLCVGCKASLLLSQHTSNFDFSKYECRFTPEGIKRVPRCPCTHCLVKVVCVEVCEKLKDICNTKYSKDKNYNKPSIREEK